MCEQPDSHRFLGRYFHFYMLLLSPLVILVGMRVDNVSDEAVVMAAVRCARVHCDADEVVLIALCDLCLTLFSKTCSTQLKLSNSFNFCFV